MHDHIVLTHQGNGLLVVVVEPLTPYLRVQLGDLPCCGPVLLRPAPGALPLGPELYEAVLAVRRAEAELFAMFIDADVIKAVRRRY